MDTPRTKDLSEEVEDILYLTGKLANQRLKLYALLNIFGIDNQTILHVTVTNCDTQTSVKLEATSATHAQLYDYLKAEHDLIKEQLRELTAKLSKEP